MADQPPADAPMAGTEEEENPTNTAEDDTSSQATAKTVHQPIPYEGDEIDYTVKFVFRPEDDKSDEVALHHFDILYTIAQVYPQIKIFNNRGAKLNRKKLEAMRAYTEYGQNYDLHYYKGNKNKERSSIYVVIHRLQSKISLSKIRRHTSVQEKLNAKNLKTKMTRHMWNENETRISTLGFFVGYDPSNILPEQMVEIVTDEIIQNTNVPKKQIPRFKCNYSSPFLIIDKNDKITSKAFDLQCRQDDAKKMIELLQRTYQQNPEFIFHRLRHKNKEEYIKTMKRQNSYLKKSRIVVLTGIHPTIMWTLADKICHEFEGVKRITKHKDTMRIGRFNVHTTTKYFDLVKDALKVRITAMVQLERSVHNLNPREPYEGRYPQVYLKHELYGSGGTGEDDAASTDHGGSFATYISSIKSTYSKQDEDNDNSSGDGTNGGESYLEPPSNNGPTPQAWTTVVPVETVVASTTVGTTSQFTSEDFERMKKENEELTTEVKELKDVLNQFIQSQKDTQASEQSQMISSIMGAMQQQFQLMLQQTMSQNHGGGYGYPPNQNMFSPYQQQQYAQPQIPNNLFPHGASPVNQQFLGPQEQPLPQTPIAQGKTSFSGSHEQSHYEQNHGATEQPNDGSEQQAASLDASMAQNSSSLAADESFAETSD